MILPVLKMLVSKTPYLTKIGILKIPLAPPPLLDVHPFLMSTQNTNERRSASSRAFFYFSEFSTI